jgi:DNA-binding NarL/FixJ family response regulator
MTLKDFQRQAAPPEFRANPEELTQRELQVLALIAEGLSTKQIAERLRISFKTAACHRGRILEKFGVHNTVSLIRQAIRHGSIEP